MTSYILFAGFGILIYAGVALTELAIAGFGDAVTFGCCAPPCSEAREAIADDVLGSGDRSQATTNRGESQAVASGMNLFQRHGCVGCHRADSAGVGPSLDSLFGSPVHDPSCGVAHVDESYLREALLNPSATVAVGFAPVMPAFEGLLTEEEVRALIEYLKSLSARR